MELNYKLYKVKELAGGDEDFVKAIAEAFLEEIPEAVSLIKEGVEKYDFKKTYENAHKIKPTVQMFELGIYNDVITLQDWGKFEQKDKDVTLQLEKIIEVVKLAVKEIKADFNL
ncbi:MAG: Hpt domain-containing protein [Flavobacteriaceae bacterium]|nr:Hpt domain-containing protein [Flavobacteriaceae bacterium]